jgi:error-prone DNA polymerase
MAAWHRTGRMERHRQRLITRMQAKGIAAEFAERVFEQIRGFGEYGFPESHAASFALIAYATAWLKCHYPAEFACALLNAQPMGFYAPATIVEDAKRHGVVVRPLDVQWSGWHCTLEECPESVAGCAVRIGLRYVKGMGEGEWSVIARARAAARFTSLADFTRRAKLDEHILTTLAEAGAFDSLSVQRRDALWEVRRLARSRDEPLPLTANEAPTGFNELTSFEEVNWDYRTAAHSPRRHPLEPLLPSLAAQALPDARGIARMPHGRKASYAGLVICRQRPGTAGGVVFMTLEDETGFVNVVVWESVFQRYALLAKTASFLGVTGTLQVEDDVVHLIAEQLWQPMLERKPLALPSRDFH